MPSAKASEVSKALRAQLSTICPDNGYLTNLQQVYGPNDTVRDKAPTPYVLVRQVSDVRSDAAGLQALRLRTFEVEGVFSKAADEGDLDALHVDVLRCLGFGQDQPERKFPGLIDSEDEAVFEWAAEGRTTHSITITLGVSYVETYN